jgi:hypothetical protein
MYNEPNLSYWTPVTNVTNYAALAKVVGNAIKAVTPGEISHYPSLPSHSLPTFFLKNFKIFNFYLT